VLPNQVSGCSAADEQECHWRCRPGTWTVKLANAGVSDKGLTKLVSFCIQQPNITTSEATTMKSHDATEQFSNHQSFPEVLLCHCFSCSAILIPYTSVPQGFGGSRP
jgi:hypothetical protein